jgi:HK97 family phage portal protein
VRLFGYELSVRRSPLPTRPATRGRDGWSAIVVREPYMGAWQNNEAITIDTALAHPAVFACTTLIASDIGKVRLRLVQEDDGIWTETQSPSFSPFLRKPNRYQSFGKFVEQWITSKLTWGNTYVLKQRDDRNVVVAGYVLDPCRVTPLVTPTGDVYYKLDPNDLAGVPDFDADGNGPIVVPASEIMHDLMVALFHPLVGVSPIYACGLSASQGLAIQQNSETFFRGGSNPGGLLLAPGKISDETAARMSKYWTDNFSGANVGKVAVLGDNLQYKPLSVNAVDSQLIEQLKWTTETVCSCYHVPVSLIDSSIQQPYGQSSEPLLQQYYSQCLQSLMTSIEVCLDDGLALPAPYGTEFDIDDLIWYDTNTRTKAASETIRSGALSPNEARRKYFGLGKVKGGDTPYLQQQMYSLEALAERDADQPFSKPTPAPPAFPPPVEPDDDEPDMLAKFAVAMTAESARVKRLAVEGTRRHGI